MPSKDREEEIALVRRFQAGDREAFQLLVERHAGALRARIQRNLPKYLRRRATVSDVLQESCLAAFRGRGAFEDQGTQAFRNWLLGIADNKVREAVRFHGGTERRAIGREVTRAGGTSSHARVGRSPTPSQVAVASEAAELARAALRMLPPDYQQVIRLRRDECLPPHKVAEYMGRSTGAVKKLYARALTHLKRTFDDLRNDDNA